MADNKEKKEHADDTNKMNIRELIVSDYGKKQFRMALPKHLTPDRFVRMAITAINRNPRLLECTRESVFECLMTLSQLGLEPDGRKAHLIPFNDTRRSVLVCTLIVDYKGYVDLVRRSGEVCDIHADVVYENDEFECSYGVGGRLYHKPAFKNRGEALGAYSFVTLKDGSPTYDFMNMEEIEAIHERSKAKDSGPWITDENEMRKKTVFRRHFKWLPTSSETSQAIQLALEKDFDAPFDITGSLPGKPEVQMPIGKSEAAALPAPENDPSKAKATAGQLKQIAEVVVELQKKKKWDKNSLGIMLDRYGVKAADELTQEKAALFIDEMKSVRGA